MCVGVIGGGAKPLVLAVNGQGVFTSRNGLAYERQATSPVNSNFPTGYTHRESVTVNGIAYVPDDAGRIWQTTNFKSFTQVSINNIASNNSVITFSGGAHLFKRAAEPSRIYAVAYQLFGGDINDAVGLWYSDDLCVNWTLLSNRFGGTHASSQCGQIVDGGDGNFYASISNAGGSTLTLVRIRISDGAVTASVSDNMANGSALLCNGSTLYRVRNNTLMLLSSFGTFTAGNTMPSGFGEGVWAATNIINGTTRHCIIGRNSNTGRLQIVYTDGTGYNSSSRIAATMPNISVSSISRGYAKIVSLGTNKGFVAAYHDSSNSANSGALFSADGITWVEATENPTFNTMSNVQLNPLVG